MVELYVFINKLKAILNGNPPIFFRFKFAPIHNLTTHGTDHAKRWSCSSQFGASAAMGEFYSNKGKSVPGLVSSAFPDCARAFLRTGPGNVIMVRRGCNDLHIFVRKNSACVPVYVSSTVLDVWQDR